PPGRKGPGGPATGRLSRTAGADPVAPGTLREPLNAPGRAHTGCRGRAPSSRPAGSAGLAVTVPPSAGGRPSPFRRAQPAATVPLVYRRPLPSLRSGSRLTGPGAGSLARPVRRRGPGRSEGLCQALGFAGGEEDVRSRVVGVGDVDAEGSGDVGAQQHEGARVGLVRAPGAGLLRV